MRLYDNLKYIGNDPKFLNLNKPIWHCTCFVKRLDSIQMEYIVQPPYYHDGSFIGYTNADAYVVTEEELLKNFKILKQDGNLENIIIIKDIKKYK